MEPDILASVGDLKAIHASWSDENIIQSKDPASVETPTDITKPSAARLHAVSAHVPVAVPRGRVHPGGFSSVHARPRATSAARAVARETVHAQTGVMPFDVPAPQGFYLRFGKRAIDILGSAAALLLLAPIITVLAVLVKLTSRGPVFYRSTRIGLGGRPFTFYKLRSMVKDADLKRQTIAHMNEADGPVFEIARDPRITGIGRFMRSTSLDEVPQFWNVLKGDMSLVGPRPPIPRRSHSTSRGSCAVSTSCRA
jgi:lipopolysaccharide/colanic/teichoic acid biosynthesis glycosyltransferase